MTGGEAEWRRGGGTRRAAGVILVLGLATGCGQGTGKSDAGAGTDALPPAPPAEWLSLIGEYATAADTMSVRESEGRLELVSWKSPGSATPLDAAVVERDGSGRGSAVEVGGARYTRLAMGPAEGNVFRITPRRPIEELLRDALAASPPEETGEFLPTDLVELVSLDSTLRLDIRYAGTDNFMSSVFYSSPRAFLQRAAAEALVRAHQSLRARGYGLLIHDGYRPWYVTKMFWDATPDSLRLFVADPSQGSRHNRGAAVDLTMVDLATGEPVEMPGVYDEFSPRSFPDYPGGTSRQRWLRQLLRQAMEAQGFTVYPAEWWHFDYGEWRRYRIGNQRFEEIGG